MHHDIFGSTLATGRFAAPSTDPYLRRGVDDDDDDDGSDDMEAFTTDTGPRSGDKKAGSLRGGGNRNQKKGKARYEASIEEMCEVYIAKHKHGASSQQSRQTGPYNVLMDQIIAIVTAIPGVDQDQMVGAIEFLRINPEAREVFIKLLDYLQANYVRRVGA